MVDELIFHLGDSKAGSTSIQAALFQKTYASDRSICYPESVSHNGVARALLKKGPQARAMRRLAHEIRASQADIAVVSGEKFEGVPPELLREAIDTWMPRMRDRVRLISYVRPHGERLTSAYAERTKTGLYSGTMTTLHEKLLAKGLLLYTPRFTAWRAVWGDRFTLRPMIRSALAGGDVVEDFFGFVFGDTPFRLEGSLQKNPSLSMRDLMALRELQAPLREAGAPMKTVRVVTGNALATLLTQAPASGTDEALDARPRLDVALAERLLADYAADADALDAAFFEANPMRRALDRSRDTALPTPQPETPESYFSPEERRRLRVTGQLLLRLAQANPTHYTGALRVSKRRESEKEQAGSSDETDSDSDEL